MASGLGTLDQQSFSSKQQIHSAPNCNTRFDFDVKSKKPEQQHQGSAATSLSSSALDTSSRAFDKSKKDVYSPLSSTRDVTVESSPVPSPAASNPPKELSEDELKMATGRRGTTYPYTPNLTVDSDVQTPTAKDLYTKPEGSSSVKNFVKGIFWSLGLFKGNASPTSPHANKSVVTAMPAPAVASTRHPVVDTQRGSIIAMAEEQFAMTNQVSGMMSGPHGEYHPTATDKEVEQVRAQLQRHKAVLENIKALPNKTNN